MNIFPSHSSIGYMRSKDATLNLHTLLIFFIFKIFQYLIFVDFDIYYIATILNEYKCWNMLTLLSKQ